MEQNYLNRTHRKYYCFETSKTTVSTYYTVGCAKKNKTSICSVLGVSQISSDLMYWTMNGYWKNVESHQSKYILKYWCTRRHVQASGATLTRTYRKNPNVARCESLRGITSIHWKYFQLFQEIPTQVVNNLIAWHWVYIQASPSVNVGTLSLCGPHASGCQLQVCKY